MTNVKKLFLFRVKKEWQYHYRVWKTAVDWIVWLYILIPFLVIIGYQYSFIWAGEARWVHLFHEALFWYILFFVSRMGTIRLFIQEGDLLFLRQKKDWLFPLMRYGFLFSLIRNSMVLVVTSSMILPVWVVYQDVSYIYVCYFLVFLFFFQLTSQIIRQFLSIRLKGWKLTVFNILFFILSLVFFSLFYFSYRFLQAILLIGLVLLTYYLVNKRLNLTSSFYEDCLRENEERLKLTTMFIGASGYKMVKKQRKRPIILFANSAKLFQSRSNSNLIGEIFIKLVMRNKTKLMAVLRLTGIGTTLLIITPFWVKWVVLAFCLFAVTHYLKTSWQDMKKHSFFKLYPKNDGKDVRDGVRKGVVLLSLPSNFLFGLVTGWSTVSPVIGLVVAISSVLIAYLFLMRDSWMY